MFFKSGRNVYGDSGRGTLFSRYTEDSVSLDSGNLLSLEAGNVDLFLCECSGYCEAEHENDKRYFFHNDLFYDGTLKGNEKLQDSVGKV